MRTEYVFPWQDRKMTAFLHGLVNYFPTMTLVMISVLLSVLFSVSLKVWKVPEPICQCNGLTSHGQGKNVAMVGCQGQSRAHVRRTWGRFSEVLKWSWLHLHLQIQARLLKAVSTSLWPHLSNCFTFNTAKSWKSSGSWRLWLHCRCLALLSMVAPGAGSEAPTALLDTAVSIVAWSPMSPGLEGWQHVTAMAHILLCSPFLLLCKCSWKSLVKPGIALSTLKVWSLLNVHWSSGIPDGVAKVPPCSLLLPVLRAGCLWDLPILPVPLLPLEGCVVPTSHICLPEGCTKRGVTVCQSASNHASKPTR